MGCGECKQELLFCSGDTALACLEHAREEITVVRTKAKRLLPEFLKYVYRELLEHLWQVREHRQFLLAAVACSGYALQHASLELPADRALAMAAVTKNGLALQHASPEL